MNLPMWYLLKEFTNNERYAIGLVEPEIVRETEKAKLVEWNTEYGIIKKWIPKSIINGTYNNLYVSKKEEKKEKPNYREILINFAKENGLNVRVNNKTKTIIQKIYSNNLDKKIDNEELLSWMKKVNLYY